MLLLDIPHKRMLPCRRRHEHIDLRHRSQTIQLRFVVELQGKAANHRGRCLLRSRCVIDLFCISLDREEFMSKTNHSLAPVPTLYGGEWQLATGDRSCSVHNPSTGKVIAKTVYCDVDQTNQIVESAAEAFPNWNQTPVIERARYMHRFRELIAQHFDELSMLLTREHGKTIGEARAEMQRGLEMAEFACGIPSLIMGQTLPEIAQDVDGETVRHPLGVCVGITPFNFPSMVPLWMFPIALTCGNTFILKPSEKVPLSAIRLGELLQQTGLPAGVFNIAHGDKSCVETLITHPLVDAISFVGSTQVARSIYVTATQHGKRVQAAGGAKNHLVIMPDADIDLAVKALAASAYGCGGQRCMAGSVAITVGDLGDRLVSRLSEYASELRVGQTAPDHSVDMGPLIDAAAVERVEQYLQIADDEGARITLDGRKQKQPTGFLIGPSIVDQVEPTMRLARDEIFGPVLSVIRANDLDSAIAIGDDCPYGNGATIFTRDGYLAREFKKRFNAGMIGINVGVPAPMAWLPFTGWNQSFFGDLHIQGTEGVHFYTKQKMTLTRWFASPEDSYQDPVWKAGASESPD